jgi:hypothetical protein
MKFLMVGGRRCGAPILLPVGARLDLRRDDEELIGAKLGRDGEEMGAIRSDRIF